MAGLQLAALCGICTFESIFNLYFYVGAKFSQEGLWFSQLQGKQIQLMHVLNRTI